MRRLASIRPVHCLLTVLAALHRLCIRSCFCLCLFSIVFFYHSTVTAPSLAPWPHLYWFNLCRHIGWLHQGTMKNSAWEQREKQFAAFSMFTYLTTYLSAHKWLLCADSHCQHHSGRPAALYFQPDGRILRRRHMVHSHSLHSEIPEATLSEL